MSQQAPESHLHEIGDMTGRKLLDKLKEIVQDTTKWRKAFKSFQPFRPRDIHVFTIYGKRCDITLKANPTPNQPGNGFVCAEHDDGRKPPYKWEEVIKHPDVKKIEFMEKYSKFLNGRENESQTIAKMYSNAQNPTDADYNLFYSLVVMFMLTFEIARRIDPPGKYPFTPQEVETAIQAVFDPAMYEGANSQQKYNDFNYLLEMLIKTFGGNIKFPNNIKGDYKKEKEFKENEQKKARKKLMEKADELLLTAEMRKATTMENNNDKQAGDKNVQQPSNP